MSLTINYNKQYNIQRGPLQVLAVVVVVLCLFCYFSFNLHVHPSSEFVVANALAKWKKLEPNEIDFSQVLARE